jgi:DNA repair exonuclease SbcCD ATPase subunit
VKELDAFLNVFGEITILNVVEVLLGLGFLYMVYKKISNFIIQQHEIQKVKDEQLKEALDGVHKYPEYRQQSVEIQTELKCEIRELREGQQELREAQQAIIKQLLEMEEQKKRKERNKLRDLLLQYYRRYASKDINPSQTWPRIEAESFWALFSDYEEAGGNGHMKDEVAPAMQRLNITD